MKNKETRPVLFLTYSYDDPDEASVLDVSGSLEAARREGNTGCPCYRTERQPNGGYSIPQFVEFLKEQR
jgi:hypothetical protein